MSDERRWAMVAHTADRPGAITAITGVFSSRGVNFDSITGSAPSGGPPGEPASGPTSGPTSGHGVIIGLYRASERRSSQLARTVGRLEVVDRVAVRPAEDPSVRAVGIMRAPEGQPRLVQGSLRAVERIAELTRAAEGTAVVVVLAL